MAEIINPAYDEIVLAKAARHLKSEKSLQLLDFLMPDALRAFEKLKFKHSYDPLKFSLHHSMPPSVWKVLPEVMAHLTGQRMKCKFTCIAAMPGDYSVLYDSLKPGKGFAVFLDVNELSESLGGYSVFMKGSKEVVRVVPRRNALTVVEQNGLRSFIKYVNHKARHSRIFLYGVLHK